MSKRIIPMLFVSFLAIAFIGCSGKGVLSQKEMDAKIEQLTQEGQKQLLPTLESACDQKFETLVQNYADSLITAANAE